MNQHDILQPFLFERAGVRGGLVALDATWQAVLEDRDYPCPVRNLLGETMAAAALLSATLKYSGSMIMQMQGDGPIPLLVVECTSELALRGLAHWKETLPDGPLSELVGSGRFAITLDPREGRRTYQGIVDLAGESVAAVLEHYMRRSEQLDTRLWLAAGEKRAVGMLLQRLPGTASSDHDLWNRAITLGGTVSRNELLACVPRELLQRLFHGEDVRVFDTRPVRFGCSCSRERVQAMLRMLGRDEVRAIIAEQGTVEVRCEFCNRRYGFDAVDAEQLFAAAVTTAPSATRH
ncbi:Hsp33 family molecular chaperone HslO [Pelomicrobium sp.]|jgi:molecular chaperone Hsp33|uniref:Hsp33 family molecular chaperone HslO n=1 Tax=Pelomicrobium sp. TaxID=2815319 RepID=UPI002FDDA647